MGLPFVQSLSNAAPLLVERPTSSIVSIYSFSLVTPLNKVLCLFNRPGNDEQGTGNTDEVILPSQSQSQR